jgi:hypothetical protein
MNTLYALIIASLSLQVWFGPSGTPTASINVSEYSTAGELLEFEGTSRDDANTPWTTATMPSLEDHSIETGLFIDDDGYTAAVTILATPKIEDQSINTGVDFFADDDAWDFKVPAKTDLHAIQASDWW